MKGFNTASGMDCMQSEEHAGCGKSAACFNTASGMDCMQYLQMQCSDRRYTVSIPQAVWIACNWVRFTSQAQLVGVSIPQAVWIACNKYLGICYHEIMKFQYRKRYGLHAMTNP